jgi:hypothetical protein
MFLKLVVQLAAVQLAVQLSPLQLPFQPAAQLAEQRAMLVSANDGVDHVVEALSFQTLSGQQES